VLCQSRNAALHYLHPDVNCAAKQELSADLLRRAAVFRPAEMRLRNLAQPLHPDSCTAGNSAMPCAVNGRIEMIGWAVTFLIIALIAGVLGFSGVAGTAANIAWILFVVGLILAIVMFIGGRRRPPV
jgi:uncharacterized membrane protein YtjA (UPF0391 family)